MDIKNWTPSKDALKLEEHFLPLINSNQKIICKTCGKRHFYDEDTFIVIYGNITIGFDGGIIGNNFYKDGTLARVSIFCRKKSCIKYILDDLN